MSAPFSAISPLRPVNSRKVIYFGQIYDATGNAIEMQEQTGDFKECVYMEKAKFRIAPESYLALGLFFKDGEEPDLFLISSNAWQTLEPPFVSRDYEGKKSKPEWGINLSKGNVSKLEPFRFHKIVETITSGTG